MDFKIQPNGYTGEAPQLSDKQAETIGLPPLVLKNNLAYDGDSIVLLSGSIQSKNFKAGVSGWRLNSDGIVDLLENSGTYTPTRSAEANLDSNVTMTAAQYMRVGNTATVSGRVLVNPTLTATTTSFEATIPVASNFGAVEEASGVGFCSTIAGMGCGISAVVANDTVKFQWVSSDVNAQTFSYTYSYQVI